MSSVISVVINTFNEEQNIRRVMESVSWAKEVVVCDQYSEDKTVAIARKLGAKVFFHKRTGYVEPVRNYAISKASGKWILVLDADEEVSPELVNKLEEIISDGSVSIVEIPRQNIIFNKWMQGSGWWPDYNIRFFKKGSVKWGNEIHRPPQTSGLKLTLPAEKNLAIIHHHYSSINQFIERMNRYTTIQAMDLINAGYRFHWQDLISKPTGEFLGRFFAQRGFIDGLHGLALALLQAFSFLIVSLKIWEDKTFTPQEINLKELKTQIKKLEKDLNYWFKYSNLPRNFLHRYLVKIKNKFL